MAILKTLLPVLATLCLTLLCQTASQDTGRLIDSILKNYDRRLRPVARHNDPVKVQVGLSLKRIAKLVGSNVTLI